MSGRSIILIQLGVNTYQKEDTANISAAGFLGSFVSTDKGTTKIESQKKFKGAKPLIKN